MKANIHFVQLITPRNQVPICCF
uniref:Uncharacterized protein n=1 Tax=Nymphaea colorata TaxID=210225 RepID=A0A5K0ZZC7_9MAGN